MMPATAPVCAACRWRWPPWGGQTAKSVPRCARKRILRTTIRCRTRPANASYGLARELVARHPEFEFRRRKPRENPSAYIVETMQAVFQALFDTDGFEACLVDVVNRGGDADTTGAIAGMLAGARDGAKAIPYRWVRALDGETRAACERQARALIAVSGV
jgi:ADP-ribosyl-[dinitrogen reductase] hydrolase